MISKALLKVSYFLFNLSFVQNRYLFPALSTYTVSVDNKHENVVSSPQSGSRPVNVSSNDSGLTGD